MYGGDFNEQIPRCRWTDADNDNDDRCYDAYVTTLTPKDGYALGLLFEAKAVPNAKVFYCLSGANLKAGNATYLDYRIWENYLNASGQWPGWLANDTGDRVRTGYSYVPQSGTQYRANITPDGKPSMRAPAFAKKTTEFTANLTITADLLYRLDMMTHRAGRNSYGVNALFGDGHVRFQTDKSFFDTQNVWNGNVNGTTTSIEDKGDNFRWLIQSFRP
jgi:prepilin-type processing-associated H-X9-DG protein